MIRRCAFIALICVSSVAAADPAPLRFSLSGADAIVYAEGGVPQFRAGASTILTYSRNPDGLVQGWDAAMNLVRISKDGEPELWLSCNDLLPIKGMCAVADQAGDPQSNRSTDNRGTGGRRPTALQAVPMCPGDPRCPVF